MAALSVHKGEITAKTVDKNNAENFLIFLKELYRKYPRKQLYVIVDNPSVHKHKMVEEWVGSKKRITLHFTPTYSSWLNQIEIWFNILTKDVLKGGIWKTRKQLIDQLMKYVKTFNEHLLPHLSHAQGTGNDINSLHSVLDKLYDEMMPLCTKLIGVGQGIAALNGERLGITVHSIRYNNSLFPVELSVFDMDGMSSLYIPGAITRDVAKQSAEQGLQDIGFTSLNPSIGTQAASAGIQAAKTLLSKKVKLIKVTVKAGYHLFLYDEKQKQNS